MERIQLTENVSISRIIQGFMRLTNQHFTVDETIDFMKMCIDKGITTFDTAEIYGMFTCEEAMGEAFKKDPELRKHVEIVTKTGINMKSPNRPYKIGHYDTTYDKIISSCKASLEKLGVDYIDVYLIHREDPLINHKEVASALEELLKRGWVKSVGVSNFDPFKLDALQSKMTSKLVTNQIEWAPTCFEHVENGNFDFLQKMDVIPMIWSPAAGGRIFTKDDAMYANTRRKLEEVALRHGSHPETVLYAWILKHPMKACPINGSFNTERIDRILDALELDITQEEWFEIYTASGQKQLR